MVGLKENRGEIVATGKDKEEIYSGVDIEIRLRDDVPHWNRVDGTDK